MRAAAEVSRDQWTHMAGTPGSPGRHDHGGNQCQQHFAAAWWVDKAQRPLQTQQPLATGCTVAIGYAAATGAANSAGTASTGEGTAV